MPIYTEILTIPDIARYWAQKTPGKKALIQDSRSLTYRELDELSNRLARAIAGFGIKPGSNIGFLGKNSIEFFAIWFAANKAGCAMTPLNWRSAEAELIALIEDAELSLVFVDYEFVVAMRSVRESCIVPFEIASFDSTGKTPDSQLGEIFGHHDVTDLRVPVSLQETALLAYTSGTTGKSKGVQITHNACNYAHICEHLEPAMQYGADDIFLMSMPNFHLTGSFLSLPALYNNGTISIMPVLDPGALIRQLSQVRPTIVALVPTAIQMLINHPDAAGADFSSLRTIYYAGSPIGSALLKRAMEVFSCDFVQFYGATETWLITLLRPDDHDPADEEKLKSCGTPLPLVEIRIVDETGAAVADGEVGELLVRSPMCFKSYWKQAEATAQVFEDGWYRTGDVGRRDANGFYYLVDRKKDMIVTGGENVYSVEVEKALYKHPAVSLAAVIGLPDQKWGERVVAFIVPVAGARLDADEIVQHCRSLIAGYKTPKTIQFVDSLPMTSTGKIQKRNLRDQYWEAEGRSVG